jgi:hypothetical protein
MQRRRYSSTTGYLLIRTAKKDRYITYIMISSALLPSLFRVAPTLSCHGINIAGPARVGSTSLCMPDPLGCSWRSVPLARQAVLSLASSGCQLWERRRSWCSRPSERVISRREFFARQHFRFDTSCDVWSGKFLPNPTWCLLNGPSAFSKKPSSSHMDCLPTECKLRSQYQ